MAYRLVADHQVAEDLLQDAFLAIWRRSTSSSPQTGAAPSWLISILHHRAIDHLRRVRRRSTLQEAPLEELELDEPTSFPDPCEHVWRDVHALPVRPTLRTR